MYIIQEINQKLNGCQVDGIHLHATEIDISHFNLVCVTKDPYSDKFIRAEIPLKYGDIDKILDDCIEFEIFVKDLKNDLAHQRDEELQQLRQRLIDSNFPISVLRNL